MNEFIEGKEAAKGGASIHQNPYFNSGTLTQFNDWVSGWESIRV